ncbi:MAG: 16S rRNA (cytosine(967)-C(5))-methyltransferase RsmB, partial [Bacillota bacterium]
STCTFSPEENKEVIDEFLSQHSNFAIINLESQAKDFTLSNYLQDGMLQIIPDDDLLEGFFIAKLIKKAEEEVR